VITTEATPRWRRSVGAGRGYLLVVPAIAIVAVYFIYPVIALSARSFLDPTVGFDQYVKLFSEPTTVAIFGRTFAVATQVTAVTLILAYPYAYLMSISGTKARTLLLFLVLLPFWSSLMARTFAWIILLQPRGVVATILKALGLGELPLLGSQFGVSLAMTQVLLPFMVLPLFNTMIQIDRGLLNAARSLGASRWRAFRKVYLPLSVPGVVAGSVLVFILSLGFWVTPRLIGSPQESLIGQLIETKVSRLLNFPAAGALSVVLLVVTMLLLIAVSGALRLLIPGRAKSKGSRDE
jgi:putative spermidine/putrescine transport system permease protein